MVTESVRAAREIYKKGKECVEHVTQDKESAHAFFQKNKAGPAGVPGDATACPIYRFLAASCPEVTITGVGGSTIDIAPVGGWEDDWLNDVVGDEAEGGDWINDFIRRVDGPWAYYFPSREITGEIALGILERTDTGADEDESFRAWLWANDEGGYRNHYGMSHPEWVELCREEKEGEDG